MSGIRISKIEHLWTAQAEVGDAATASASLVRHFVALSAFCVFLFFINLGGHGLWPPDEPRFAQVAREMMQSHDYLSPRINGLPYQEKPPLLFWLMILFSLPMGDVTEFTARVPSAAAGLVTVLITYAMARRLFNARTALWSGLILSTTQLFWWEAHVAQIDMVLTAAVAASLFFLWTWHRTEHPWLLAGFYTAIAVGAFAKGPPAAVFPVLTALVFFWRDKPKLQRMHLVIGLSIAAAAVVCWLVPARMAVAVETSSPAGASISSNLFRQTIGRFFLGVSHANPPWYYLFQTPVDLFPWSLFLPWTVWWTWKERQQSEPVRFLAAWILPAFLFFSICIGKREIYLLPLFPAFAMLFAHSLLPLVDGPRLQWRRWTGVVFAVVLLAAGAAPIAANALGLLPLGTFSLAVMCCGCTCVAGLMLADCFARQARLLPHGIMAGFAVLAVCVVLIVLPAVDPAKSAKDFCKPLRALNKLGVPYDLYSVGFSREEYVYYAEHFHQEVPSTLFEENFDDPANWEAGQQKLKLLRVIQKAVAAVPLTTAVLRTEMGAATLRQALEKGIEKEGTLKTAADQLEAALTKSLDDLFEVLDSPSPALIIAQENDWRWVTALHPAAGRMMVVEDRPVGSRDMLLLANPAANGLLARVAAQGA